MRFLASFVLVALLLAAAPAHAAEHDWYGWEIALTDAVSIGFAATGRSVPAWIGLAGFTLGGPLIHVAHGDYPEAALDLGARVVLPVGFTLLGAAAQGPCDDCEGIGGGPIVGLLAGTLAAMTIDYGLLSTHERVAVAPTRGGALLSLSGRF